MIFKTNVFTASKVFTAISNKNVFKPTWNQSNSINKSHDFVCAAFRYFTFQNHEGDIIASTQTNRKSII